MYFLDYDIRSLLSNSLDTNNLFRHVILCDNIKEENSQEYPSKDFTIIITLIFIECFYLYIEQIVTIVGLVLKIFQAELESKSTYSDSRLHAKQTNMQHLVAGK